MPILPGSSAAALRDFGLFRTVVVTVHGERVEPVIVHQDLGPLDDVTVPGAADAAVLGDLGELLRPPKPGESLGGTFAWSAAGGLEPVTLRQAVTASIAQARRGPSSIVGWLLLLIVVGLMWWFFLGLLALGLGAVVFNQKRLLVGPDRIEWRAGRHGFRVRAPYKVRAKIRFSRGTQSKKRKTKASLVIVDDQRVEHVVPFANPEALLRFTRALAVVHGIPWRLDVKIRGEKLDGATLAALLPLPTNTTTTVVPTPSASLAVPSSSSSSS